MVVFFSNSEDAAADARADVFDELLVAHLALPGRIIQVDNLDGFLLRHRQIQLPHGVACVRTTLTKLPRLAHATRRHSDDHVDGVAVT